MADRSEQPHAPAVPPSIHPSPYRLNLEQQRKRAKELRQALIVGDANALRRFRQHHPKGLDISDAEASTFFRPLNQAQLVIARELGLPSWPRLKAHILAMQQARGAISKDKIAPDRDFKTLHIRCGHTIETSLREAGFSGDFLEYADPLDFGPLTQGGDWLKLRANFHIEAYGAEAPLHPLGVLDELELIEKRLRSAGDNYERIVLWVEHHRYNQLILARCLAEFAVLPPHRLELICVNHFPTSMYFGGLGHLPPEALRLLWNRRKAVSGQQLSAGRSVWRMIRSPNPTALAEAAKAGFSELPFMADAVCRHCQELPWLPDGLSLTERLILKFLAERPGIAAEVYSDLLMVRGRLTWLGDLTFRFIVENMKRVSQPVFTGVFETEKRSWVREKLTITELGRAVLAGEVDYLSLLPPPRWVGGVHIQAPSPCWRWDDQTATTILL